MRKLKLLKTITILSTTAFLFCLTTTTIPTLPSIIVKTEETETTETPTIEQEDTSNKETEPELQPFSDDPDDRHHQSPLF